LLKKINNIWKQVDTAVIFLDVPQAFGVVWHSGLLYKIKNSFLIDLYVIIRCYLLDRTFRVKYGEEVTQLN
jgi:hypothetical protein